MVDDLAKAYAVLGLTPGASFKKVRQSYRALAKRWHPDRHAADEAGVVQAAETMARVNAAYAAVAASLGNDRRHGSARAEGRRLSREEIDSIIATVQASEPPHPLTAVFGSVGSRLAKVVRFILAAALVARVAYLIRHQGLEATVTNAAFWAIVAAAAVLVAYERLERRRTLGRAE